MFDESVLVNSISGGLLVSCIFYFLAEQAKLACSSVKNCKMFDKAMQEKVETKRKRSAIVGVCGVGKTHSIALIMGEKPPSQPISTPICEVPKRIGHLKIHKDATCTYQRIPLERYSQMVMKSGKECIEHSMSSGPIASVATRIRQAFFRPRTPTEHVERDLKIRLHQADDTVESLQGKVVLEMSDSGGQPQFLEILPKFLRNLTLLIIVTNISQRFDEYPLAYFFGEDGKAVGEGLPSRITNEQMLRQFLQMVASLSWSERRVKFMFVGTHRDLEHICSESREEKEAKLLEMIKSFKLEDRVIYNNEEFERVIFAINGKTPEKQDCIEGQRIIEKIMDEKDAETIIMPVNYHSLELTMKQMVSDSGINQIAFPLHQVLDKMSHYYFSEESLRKGLCFLDKSNRILYFEREFPEWVIGEPQAVLDKVTKIVGRHIKMTTDPSAMTPREGTWKKFKEQGIVTNEILSEFPEGYVKGIFTIEDMLKVLEVMLIVFEADAGEYLMPCLLKAERFLPIIHHSIIPLLLHFPSGTAGLGVYCSTVCHLIAVNKWKLLGGSCVARNRFQFRLPGRPGFITLDDSFDSYFVVNISIPSEARHVFAPMCLEVRDTLINAISKVTKSLNYNFEEPEISFFCEKHPHMMSYQADVASNVLSHPATISKDGSLLLCTKDPNCFGRISEEQTLWLNGMFIFTH